MRIGKFSIIKGKSYKKLSGIRFVNRTVQLIEALKICNREYLEVDKKIHAYLKVEKNHQ
jgi:hypothetical protein